MSNNANASLLGDGEQTADQTPPATPPSANADPIVNPGTEQEPGYDWISGLPDELKSEASLKVIHGKDEKEVLQALAKSYVHSQRHMGSDKIPVPTKHATEDDWKQVFKKLGLPENEELYEMDNLPEGVDKNSEAFKEFKKKALEAGILPRQAEKMLAWVHSSAEAQKQKFIESQAQSFNETITSLKNEWGNAFEGKLAKIRSTLKEVGGDEFVAFLNDSGFGNRIEVVRFAEKLSQKFAEDSTESGNPNVNAKLTPQEAQARLSAIYKNPKHPYFDSDHVNHHSALEEVRKLSSDAYPG